MPEVQPRNPERKDRGSIIAGIVDNLDGEYWTISEVSETTGVSVSTLRRWMRNGTTKAPSHEVNQGELRIYLFDKNDVQEIKDVRDNRRGKDKESTR